jgi:Zn-dependent M28 family amino/carboxypeptidase
MGQSSLDDLAATVAGRQGRTLLADPEPEKGFYYRSDHFELAKVGIPAFYADVGITFEGRPEGWGEAQRAKYTADDYHKPSDEIKDWYELSGMVQDLELFYEMGLELATSDAWPEWSDTSEFKSKRSR